MQKMRVKLLRKFRQSLYWLWQQDGSAGQRARGIGIGVFCGCFPFFGIQIILSVGLASIFNGNRLLAATGTLISNPLTYVPLYYLNYRIGSSLIEANTKEAISPPEIFHQNLFGQSMIAIHRILLGSTITALILSIISGYIVYIYLRYCAHKTLKNKDK